jgi:hypothetical protein
VVTYTSGGQNYSINVGTDGLSNNNATLSYSPVTGSISMTLSLIPDTGSAIVIQYGSAGASVPFRDRFRLEDRESAIGCLAFKLSNQLSLTGSISVNYKTSSSGSTITKDVLSGEGYSNKLLSADLQSSVIKTGVDIGINNQPVTVNYESSPIYQETITGVLNAAGTEMTFTATGSNISRDGMFISWETTDGHKYGKVSQTNVNAGSFKPYTYKV